MPIQQLIKNSFEISPNVVISVPIGIEYFRLPDIIKNCVGRRMFDEGNFSMEIEEIYNNEVLEQVFLYFGNTAQITLQEEIDVLTKYITPNPENLSHKQAIRNCVDRHGI